MTSAFSPYPQYLGAGASALIGINCILRPAHEASRFGVPQKDAGPKKDVQNEPSPFIYLKGSREFSYALAIAALQYQGNDVGVTTVYAIMALVAASDGLVVWVCGGPRDKAFGHGFAGVGLACWAWWRSQ